jgi:hypothetical protein
MCHVRLSLVSQSVQQYVDLETKACLLLRCDAASLGKWFANSFETSEILYPVSQRHIAEYQGGFVAPIYKYFDEETMILSS